jgi:hypothetical protein
VAVLFRVALTVALVQSGGDVSAMSAFRQVELLALGLARTMTMVVAEMVATMVAVVVRAAPLLQMLAVLAVLQLDAAEMEGLAMVAVQMAAAVVTLSAVGLKDALAAIALPLALA